MIQTIEEALQVINDGKLLVVQTDTVLGIIADGTNAAAVERLYALKKRDKSKSSIVFVKDQAAVAHYAQHIPRYATQFMKAFWPGALTLVFQAKELTENLSYLADEKSIAILMPNERHLLDLLSQTSKTIISTSANMSGAQPYYSLEQARSVFGEAAVYWNWEDESDEFSQAIASTIIDCQDASTWQILREGNITKEMLWEVLDSNKK